MSCLGKLCNCSKSSGKKEEHLRVLFKSSRANSNVSASLRRSAEMHIWSDARKRDKCACKLKLRHEDSTRSTNMSWDAERNLNRHAWPLMTFLCKSLVFGFIDTDSFCYFDSIYNLQIKFIFEYLRLMVIHCKKLNQILLILWGDIHDLSQILHYPGNDSMPTWIHVLRPSIPVWLNVEMGGWIVFVNLSATCCRIVWLFTQRFFSPFGINYKYGKWKALTPNYDFCFIIIIKLLNQLLKPGLTNKKYLFTLKIMWPALNSETSRSRSSMT